MFDMMIKKIFLYIALVMSLASCSDDFLDGFDIGQQDDGSFNISLRVPGMEHVSTRAISDENAVENLLMLVFDGNGKLKQKDYWTGELTSHLIQLDESMKNDANVMFYFIANSTFTKDSFTDDTEIDVVKTHVMSSFEFNENMTMTGIATRESLKTHNPVYLFRNAAKVTVHNNDASKTPYPFIVLGPAEQSALMAGAVNNSGSKESLLHAPLRKIIFPENIDDTNTAAKYLHATQNTGTYLTNSYIIVKAKYGGKDYYYRLDFQKKEKEDNDVEVVKVLDIVPNHHYEVTILRDPASAGFATPEEASKYPVPLNSGWYVIDDHAPKIYNIVTDGSHELGVSHLVFNGNAANGSTADLYVKVYSINSKTEEEQFYTEYQDLISFNKSWISLDGTITEVTAADGGEEFGDNTSDITGSNIGGRIFRIPLKFDASGVGDFGDGKATGKVVWAGLTRDFKIEWDNSFDVSQLFEYAKITIKDGNGSVQWGVNGSAYFDFLQTVAGISEDANNGYARDNGFHFPLMYGADTNNPWTYEYDVQFNKLAEGNYTWEAEIEGDNAVKKVNITNNNSQTLNGTGPHLKLTCASANDWDYGTGNLIITVTNNSGNEKTYSVPLFHTGFFHKDVTSGTITANEGSNSKSASILAGSADDTYAYTYYEVITTEVKSIGVSARETVERHWLDRNLGAHSAEMYIENGDGTTYMGNPDAAGYYYRIAGYDKYNKPVIKDGICPPGYDYPTEADFDQLRADSKFSTAQEGNYNTARFKFSESKTVYFPKALYKNSDDTKAGDARSGYYWTSTAASGTEKEEIGAWLKCFNIVGNSTSYFRGEVVCPVVSKNSGTTRAETNGYAMPIRCINKSATTPTYEKVNFFVNGATHVYMYTKDKNGVKTSLTSWPGKAVGTYLSVLTEYFNFLYETTSENPSEIYLIFNYKTQDGQIISYSANASNKQNFRRTTDVSPTNLTGWQVNTDKTPASGLTADCGGTWTITNPASTSGSITYTAAPKEYKFRIYFNSYNNSGINIWYGSSSSWADEVCNVTPDSKIQSTKNGTYFFYSSGNGYKTCYFEFSQSYLLSNFPTLINVAKNKEGSAVTVSSSQFALDSDGAMSVTIKNSQASLNSNTQVISGKPE